MGNNNIDDLIIKNKREIFSKYNNPSSYFDNLFTKPGDDFRKQALIPVSDPFEADYQRMRQVAREDDDFKKVLNVFEGIYQRAQGRGMDRAKQALREAYGIYTQTQKDIARLFAQAGQYDPTEEHLQKAHSGCTIRLSSLDEIVLEPNQEDPHVKTIVDTAMRQTSPAYFLERVVKASEQGDVPSFHKYAHLTLNSLALHGLLLPPQSFKIEEDQELDDEKYERFADFLRLNAQLGRLLKETYNTAIRKKVEEAIGYAVNNSSYSATTDADRIKRLRLEALDLSLEAAQKTTPPAQRATAMDGKLATFNLFVDPLFEELVACRKDPQHPLRRMYKPTHQGGYSWGEISGVERVPVTTTEIVPANFYQKGVEQTGIPLNVHPFFNSVAERYGLHSTQ